MTMVRFHPVEQRISGAARVPYSKPHMQRAILLSLLTNAPSIIVNPAWSSEATQLYRAARQFGLDVLHGDGNKLIVKGVGKSLIKRKSAITAVGSAFNFRTVAGLACLSPDETLLEGNASMLARPVREHLGFISDLGGRFDDVSDDDCLRVRVRGTRALGGHTVVDTRHSSQVLTSVLLISPLAGEPVHVRVTDNPVGEGYIDLTLEMMREQGAPVSRDGLSFMIEPAAYQSRIHHIASDFTALSYLAGAVATAPAGELVVRGYYPSTLSSEAEFLKTLELLGVRPTYDPVARSLRLNKETPGTRSIEIDGRNIPTVVPTLTAMAPYIDADVTVRNVGHVNNHKCRRIEVMITELRRMGCDIDPTFDRQGRVDGFATGGPQRPVGGVLLDSHDDHRVFMSLATAALGARRPTTIAGAEQLHASFPNYVETMSGIGVDSASARTDVRWMNGATG
jgi:3-phosphoshikimate 1-carboxyvinyltransferase